MSRLRYGKPMYQLSAKSLTKLDGVNEQLVSVVKRAIELTTCDFGITEGLRSEERQLELYNQGKSQIPKGGMHCLGRAVDLMAMPDGKGSWDLMYYQQIADAMKAAAIELGVGVRWGGAWTVPDIRDWNDTMQKAYDAYVSYKHGRGEKPFIDAPHFELAKNAG